MSLQPSQSSSSAWYEALDNPPSAPPSPAERVADAVYRALHADDERRLLRTEAAIAGSTQMEREALCEWLGGMLHRPPLDHPTPAWAAMWSLVEALWWDLAARTPDPLEPDALSPNIIPNHPWGEGAES